MTKYEFLKQLDDAISSLPKAERKRRIDYYSELIDDMVEDGMPEQAAVERLGDVQQIAAGILQDTPLPQKPRRHVAAIVLACAAGVLALSLLAVFVFAPIHGQTVENRDQVQQISAPAAGTGTTPPETTAATPPSTAAAQPSTASGDTRDTEAARISATTPGGYQKYENAYAADGAYTIPATGIHEIELRWLAGTASIRPYDGTDILLQESAGDDLTQAEALRYGIRNGKLHVQYCDPGHYDSLPVKQLEIYVPTALAAALGKLEAEAASAQIYVENLCLQELDLETVSGNVYLQGVQAQELDMETVSGEVVADGEFDVVDLSSTSGALQLVARTQPRELDIETGSGPVSLQLPEDSGFSLKFETASGSLGGNLQLRLTGKSYQAGDGSGHYQVETISADVTIDVLPA